MDTPRSALPPVTSVRLLEKTFGNAPELTVMTFEMTPAAVGCTVTFIVATTSVLNARRLKMTLLEFVVIDPWELEALRIVAGPENALVTKTLARATPV